LPNLTLAAVFPGRDRNHR